MLRPRFQAGVQQSLGSARHRLLRHYLQAKESATQANHAISNKQLLYVTDPVTPGSVFFLPHGTRIFNKLVNFMKHQQLKYGFQEVITPLIYKTKLWEQSGHWQNYKDDMFKVVGNDPSKEEDMHEYGLKPMNCPGHCVIFSKFERSYNELPVRLSDFSSLHRNEASGALSGLTRVRRFHQDDGHIFCEMAQIREEITNTVNLIKNTYSVFGIRGAAVEFLLSTRPDKFMGEIPAWDEAERQLSHVLDETAGAGKWHVRPGDGAFYGPKIDVMLTDAFEKKHQVGTIQLDFQLPARFELEYISAENNERKRPIMIHRAVFGSLERFFAILLDHYQGKWPFWLNPRQAVVIPVSDKHVDVANEVRNSLVGEVVGDFEVAPLTGHHFHVDVDARSETVGQRIKEAVKKGYSYLILVGDKDIASGTISVRTRDDRKVVNMKAEELYAKFVEHEKNYE